MHRAQHPDIVVFTYGRPESVRRLADFYVAYPGRLIVVDGSPAAVGGLRMPPRGEYLHRPGRTVHQRIAEGLSVARSPSCALAADDDYHVADGLLACAQAIESDPGIACAAGTAVYFTPTDRSMGRAVADCAVERILAMESRSTGADRFKVAIASGPQAYYACMRTSVARRVGDALSGLPDADGLVGEQLWNALPALFGSHRLVDRLQLVRRMANRDYTGYLAPFVALDDIAEWHGFRTFCQSLRAIAAEAGLGPSGEAEVIAAWRDFAAETGRGRRSWKQRRLSAAVRLNRSFRNLLTSLGVAADPRAWRDPIARNVARGRASRVALRCRSYPWSDPDARAEFERVMAFDAQAAARA